MFLQNFPLVLLLSMPCFATLSLELLFRNLLPPKAASLAEKLQIFSMLMFFLLLLWTEKEGRGCRETELVKSCLFCRYFAVQQKCWLWWLVLRIIQIILQMMKMQKMEWPSDEEVEFQQNEVVWAKITGHPWWPAIITAMPTKRNTNFRVDFFADNTHAYVAPSKIAKYQLLRSDVDLHRHMKKGLRKAIGSADQAVAQRVGLTLGVNTAAHEVEATVLSQKQLCELPSIKSTQLQGKKQGEEPLEIIQEESQPIIPQHQGQEGHAQEPIVPEYSYEERERYVNNLLVKYQLDDLCNKERTYKSKYISRTKISKSRRQECRQNISKGRRGSGKLKRFEHSLFYLLSKRLDKFLKKKQLSKQKRRIINVNLARQIENSHNLRIETAIQEVTKLLKWLDISSSGTIDTYYQSWSSIQAEKQKPSNMTHQE